MIPCILGIIAVLALLSAAAVAIVSACADVCRLARRAYRRMAGPERIVLEQSSAADTESFPAAVTIPLAAIPT